MMRHTGIVFLFVVGLWMMGAVIASAHNVEIFDDCDPADAAWNPTGGCALDDGDVTFAEFNAERLSPLAAAIVGHQAWRNDPAYLKIEFGDTVNVKNKGGRAHTFTEVENFGGGTVPPLNVGLEQAPECVGAAVLAPGARTKLTGLSVGNHRFQCCLHPWMRALIKVLPEE
jgi:plastocyanin